MITSWQRSEMLKGDIDTLRLDRYLLLDHLDEGGFGLVYKAKHVLMDRIVALKALRRRMADDAESLQRFQREVTVNGRLDHPNLLRAFDVFQAGDALVLVLEYCNGPNLYELVKRSGPLPIAVACDCARQAARGLAYLHRMGLVHRDIKPGNMLLLPVIGGRTEHSWGTIKILDMGLVRLIHGQDATHALPNEPSSDRSPPAPPQGATLPDAPLTEWEDMAIDVGEEIDPMETAATAITGRGAVLGTIEFMAPEQAVDTHRVDYRADLYSLGATLFYLLSGQTPFADKGHFVKRMLQLAKEQPPNVCDLRPDCPDELGRYINRLLSKKPEDRPASAPQVAEELSRFVPARSLSLTDPAVRGPR
jgi:serine/threonine protein kinase